MPFQPDLRWTTWEKNDPQRDTVEIFDEDGRLPVYEREKKKKLWEVDSDGLRRRDP